MVLFPRNVAATLWFGKTGLMVRMSDERMIRKDNLKLLLKHHGLSVAEFAKRHGCSDTYVRKLLSGKPGTFGEKTARDIEETFKKDRFWLDRIHSDGEYDAASRAEALPPESAIRESNYRATQEIPARFIAEPASVNLLPIIKWERLEMLEVDNNSPALIGFERASTEGLSSPKSKWVEMHREDDSMTGVLPAGSRLRVDMVADGASPTPGCFVLCTNSTGEYMVRRYKHVTKARFQVEACNPGYATLDNQDDAIQIVGIVRQALINL